MITLPNFFSRLFWVSGVSFCSPFLLYPSSFLTVFSYFTFSTYILSSLRWNALVVFTALVRRSYCSDFILIQENRFDIIGSKSCHFCVWDEFLAIEKACILFAVFIARIFLRFIFLPLYQACYQDFKTSAIHGLSCLSTTVPFCILIIRSLDSNTSGMVFELFYGAVVAG